MKTNNAGSQVYTAGEFFCGFSFGSGWNVILYEICLQENKILGTITFVFCFCLPELDYSKHLGN